MAINCVTSGEEMDRRNESFYQPVKILIVYAENDIKSDILNRTPRILYLNIKQITVKTTFF